MSDEKVHTVSEQIKVAVYFQKLTMNLFFFDFKVEYGNKTCRTNEKFTVRFIYFPPNTAGECKDHINNSAYFIKLR